MYKKCFILIVLLIPMVICSCSLGEHMTMLTDDNIKKADARMEQIFEAIASEDKEALQSLFSKQALEEAGDIGEQIDCLFKLYQGEKESCKYNGVSSGFTIDHGKKSIQLNSWYTVKTDKEKYRFFVVDYPEDTINPDNAGLYALQVTKVEDEETQIAYGQEMIIAGIYLPEK